MKFFCSCFVIFSLATFGGEVDQKSGASIIPEEGDFLDPWKGLNSSVFQFNQISDKFFLVPVSHSYEKLLGRNLHKKMGNFWNNLNEPRNLIHLLLQAKPKKAIKTLLRFVINSTIGIGGIYDPAKHVDFKMQTEDLGQTLGHYGYGNSNYIILPFLGPSTTRDTSGMIGDIFLNPITYTPHGILLNLLRMIHFHSEYQEFREVLIEDENPYQILRDSYLGQRDFSISE